MTRVFVTGGSGLIGSALVRALLDRGDEVRALTRSESSADTLRRAGAQPVVGDVLDERSLAAAMQDCEVVYHVAGENSLCPRDPGHMLRVNVQGAAAVARTAALANVRRLVHTSSAASVGERHGTIGREDSEHRGSYLSVYERSKHEGERAVLDIVRSSDLEAVVVCPASVQGPGRVAGTGKLLLAYLNGRLRVFIDTTISIVDIADCISGHLLAADRGTPGERYLLCGAALPVDEAFALAGRIAGVSGRPLALPPTVARAGATLVQAIYRARRQPAPVCREMVATLLHAHRYDGSRATRELGLQYTPLEETLRRTLDWAAAQGLVEPRR